MGLGFSLENKVIIVTGATGVLGKSFVDGLTDAGATVVVLGRNAEVAEERVKEIHARGGKAIAGIADVQNIAQLEAVRDLVISTYGKIDGLVNGAGGNRPGGVLQPEQDVFELNLEGLKDVLDLNLWGTILPTQIFGKEIAKNGGSIVNISSMSAQRAITKVLGYSLAKGAIDTYTRWMALELANRYQDKIRINAIAPGFFLTEQNRTLLTNEDGSYTTRGSLVINQTPFKRFGHPDELIGALVWLLSDASVFVTGTVVNVDGGFIINSGV